MNVRYFLFVTLLAIVCAGLAWWFQVSGDAPPNPPTTDFGQSGSVSPAPAPANPTPAPGGSNLPNFQ